jgi:glycerate 2-kinase
MSEERTVVVAPDSFKGSLPAAAVAAAIAGGWAAARPDDRVVCVPLADGGEGTMDGIEAAVRGTRRHTVRGVSGPDGRPVDADWLELPERTALVELAAVSGLPQIARLDPLGATTRGLGQLIAAACDAGSERLFIALGGSATSDGGTGAFRELGLVLRDAAGGNLDDGGGALTNLATVDSSGLRPPPPGGVEILTDVDNPLLGELGAAAVFGPQKGAGQEEIARLEAGLARLAELVGGDPTAAGAGAAGGAGYGFAALWGATTRAGSRAIAELAGLPDALADADLVITGEGTLDATSLGGKAVGHVLWDATGRGVPVVAVAGMVADADVPARRIVSISELAGGAEASMADPDRWLRAAGRLLAEAADELWAVRGSSGGPTDGGSA